MASEPDNPFARNSAWPKMPQAPFRVGPLPKADTPPAPPPEEPARQTVTPVFTRPTNGPPAFSGLPAGAITRPAPQPSPTVAPPRLPPTPEPVAAAAPPAPEPVPAPSPPVEPPEPYTEVAPVIVRPAGARRAVPRRSPLPAIAATGVGLAAILGIAYALNRGQEAALEAPAAPPPATIAAPPTPEVTPVPPPTVETPVAVPPTAPRVAAQRAVPAPRRVAPPAPVAVEEAVAAPVLALPPPPVVVQPAAPPQPTYVPPAAPDPGAPMTTRRD